MLELKKKNILLRKRAEEFIALKSQAIQSYMAQNEISKQEIAYSLHENTLQDLASALMLLRSIKKTLETVMNKIDNVREILIGRLKEVGRQVYKMRPPVWSIY